MAAPPQLQSAELATLIPLSSFYEHFQCSICLGEIVQCALLPCSHQFCDSCIRECLNRKHQCPLCLVDANVGALVRNSAFDQLLASVKAAQRVSAAKLVKKLLPKRPAPVVGAVDAGAAGDASMSDVSDALPHNDAAAAPPSLSLARTDSQSSGPLSPIEALFREHVVSRVMLPFEQVYQGLVAERASCLAQEVGEPGRGGDAAASAAVGAEAAAAASSSASSAASAAPCPPPSASTAFYGRALSRVVEAYERYLLDLPCAAFLEPIACTVSLHPGPSSFSFSFPAAAAAAPGVPGSAPATQYRLQVHAWDDVGSVARRLVAESRRPEHAGTGTPPLRHVALDPTSLRFVLTGVGAPAAASAAAAASSSSATAAAGGGGVVAGNLPHLPLQLNLTAADRERALVDIFGVDGVRQCSLDVRGNIEFERSPSSSPAAAAAAAQPASRCFKHTYRQDEADQRVDYYKCQQCALNWICKSCATSCHAGHALSPFMIAHKPTYAACYCNKKKACVIEKNK